MCHSVLFVLCIFSFRKTENFFVSAMQRLKQTGKNGTILNVTKNTRTYLLTEAVVQRCSVKKVLVKFVKIHRKIPVPESLF